MIIPMWALGVKLLSRLLPLSVAFCGGIIPFYVRADECPENKPCFSPQGIAKLHHLMQEKEPSRIEIESLVFKEGKTFTLNVGELCFSNSFVPNCPNGSYSISTCMHQGQEQRLFACRANSVEATEANSDCLSEQSKPLTHANLHTLASTNDAIEKNVEIILKKGQIPDLQLINDLVHAAKHNQSMLAFRHKADLAFLNKDYAKAAYYSKLEMAFYPVVNVEGLKFRIDSTLTGFPINIINLNTHDKIITLSKVVPKQHLCNISKNGLDSQFGGVSGAKEHVGTHGMYDRGRMYFANGAVLKENSFYGDDKYFKVETVNLVVEIPFESTDILNLIFDGNNDWFIAGTTIPPKYITVQATGKGITPLDFSKGYLSHKKYGIEFVPIEYLSCKEQVK